MKKLECVDGDVSDKISIVFQEMKGFLNVHYEILKRRPFFFNCKDGQAVAMELVEAITAKCYPEHY